MESLEVEGEGRGLEAADHFREGIKRWRNNAIALLGVSSSLEIA